MQRYSAVLLHQRSCVGLWKRNSKMLTCTRCTYDFRDGSNLSVQTEKPDRVSVLWKFLVCELQLDLTMTLKGIIFADYFPLSRLVLGLVAVLVLPHFEMNYFVLSEIATGNYGHFHEHPPPPPGICPLAERGSAMKRNSIRMLQKGRTNLL